MKHGTLVCPGICEKRRKFRKSPLLRTKYNRFDRVIVPKIFGGSSRRLTATIRRFYVGRFEKNPANFAVRLPGMCSDVFTVTITIKTSGSDREGLGSRFLRRQIAFVPIRRRFYCDISNVIRSANSFRPGPTITSEVVLKTLKNYEWWEARENNNRAHIAYRFGSQSMFFSRESKRPKKREQKLIFLVSYLVAPR